MYIRSSHSALALGPRPGRPWFQVLGLTSEKKNAVESTATDQASTVTSSCYRASWSALVLRFGQALNISLRSTQNLWWWCVMPVFAMRSILFLDFSSCISSLRTQPLVLSVSNVTHSGHSHSNTSKQAIWCWTRWHRKQHRSGARRDTGAAYVSASMPKLHMFTCLNYTCNSEIRAYEFINSMNSYTTEFRGFMNSYTYEFISIWIHSCIHIEFMKKFEFKYEFIKWLWIHIWIHGSQLFLTNEFSAIYINSYTN